jgi:uncharacterized phiE125 gp8 family phage protein
VHAQAPERVSAPATPLLSLDEVKLFLRIEPEEHEEDSLLGHLIGAATAALDGWAGLLGRALIDQQWRQRLSAFPDEPRLALPLGPVRAPPQVLYRDPAGAEQSFADFHLVRTALGPGIALADGARWPATAVRPDAVTLTWTAGYGPSPSDVPEPVRTAALLLIAHWHQNREAVVIGTIATEVPWGLRQLIAQLRACGT